MAAIVREYEQRVKDANQLLCTVTRVSIPLCCLAQPDAGGRVWLLVSPTGATALNNFNLINMLEHADVAAMVRIALVHFNGYLMMLPRRLPDWEPWARSRLQHLENGLDRLRSEQVARNLAAPSWKHAGAKGGQLHHHVHTTGGETALLQQAVWQSGSIAAR